MSQGATAYEPGMRPGRRVLVSDVDGTLLDSGAPGDGTAELGARLRSADAALVLSSGRDLALSEEAAEKLAAGGLPRPSGLVCGVGTEIYLLEDGRYVPDGTWSSHLEASGFDAPAVRRALAGIRGLTTQPPEAQTAFKVSYYVDPQPPSRPVLAAAMAALQEAGIEAGLVFSADLYLDVLPRPASKGSALLHLARLYDLRPADVVAAGDSGNDRDLLTSAASAGMTAVLVANHEPEMADLRDVHGIHVAAGRHALGVLEGIDLAGW